MISVVIACYNGIEYLKLQLHSILRQSCLPDEIILTDDASSDGTWEWISQIHSDKVCIRAYRNEVQLGYAENFRKAISLAKGDLIFLCDQDDLWMPEKIGTCVRWMSEHPEILSLNTGFWVWQQEESDKTRTPAMPKLPSPCSQFKTSRPRKISWKSFVRHPKYPGMAMVFRRELWARVNAKIWHPEAAHDWLINEETARRGGLYYLPEKLVFYRQHGDNTVGVLRKSRGKALQEKRRKLIGSLIGEAETVLSEDNLDKDKKSYLRGYTSWQRKRLQTIRNRDVPELLKQEAMGWRYTTPRAIMGDLYTVILS